MRRCCAMSSETTCSGRFFPMIVKMRGSLMSPRCFELADSNMNFNASPTKVYKPFGATGKSDWNALFTYILDRFRERSTAFVLVDDRDLT